MNKLVLLFCVSCALSVSSNAAKSSDLRDIIDQARKQLEKLQKIVQGAILAAQNDLGIAGSDFLTYSNTAIQGGAVALQQEHGAILAQVTTVEEVAHTAGKNISECIDRRKEVLNRLPASYSMKMFRCIGDKVDNSKTVLKDSMYIVDVAINEVQELEFQLDRCGDSILCIQPILAEIQLDMIRVPENIEGEVIATISVLNNFDSSIDECVSVEVSEYASNANSILDDLIECANEIIGFTL